MAIRKETKRENAHDPKGHHLLHAPEMAEQVQQVLREKGRNMSDLTERRAFIETFVKEIVVMPGDALLRYTIPMPDDSPIPGRNAEEMALNGSVLSTVKNGGPERTELRTFRWEVAI